MAGGIYLDDGGIYLDDGPSFYPTKQRCLLKENMKELCDILNEVRDERSFLDFAKALVRDRQANTNETIDMVGFAGDWANNDIAGFLEAAISWAEDSDFGIEQDAELASNKWKQFAVFLYCGKIYE